MGGNISKQASDAGDAFGSKVSQKMGEMQQGQMVLSKNALTVRSRKNEANANGLSNCTLPLTLGSDKGSSLLDVGFLRFCLSRCNRYEGQTRENARCTQGIFLLWQAPLVMLPWVIGYQADMVWGNKMDRINRWALEEAEDNSNWFVPISPSNLDEVPDALKQRPTTKPT